eukprot:GHVN01023575.1.p1 GENE.GHVN01023575.1~~GHVN01023575.1.p1  ORF type:complete len:682 (+),score=103.96 GHVN01023575.1:269-2314(+)
MDPSAILSAAHGPIAYSSIPVDPNTHPHLLTATSAHPNVHYPYYTHPPQLQPGTGELYAGHVGVEGEASGLNEGVRGERGSVSSRPHHSSRDRPSSGRRHTDRHHRRANEISSPHSDDGAGDGAGGGGGDRKTTDTLWLLALCGVVVMAVAVMVVGLVEGNIGRLYKGVNYSGLVCGVSEPVQNLPLLYYPMDPSAQHGKPKLLIHDARCVASCPTQTDVDSGLFMPVAKREAQTHEGHGSALMMEFRVQSPVYASTPIGNSLCFPVNPILRSQLTPHLTSMASQFRLAIGGFASSWLLCVSVVIFGFCITVVLWVVTGRIIAPLSVWVAVGGSAVSCVITGGYLLSCGVGSGEEEVRMLYSLNYYMSIIVGTAFICAGIGCAVLSVLSFKTLKSASSLLDATSCPLNDVPSIFLPALVLAACGLVFMLFWGFVMLKIAGMGKLSFEPEILLPLEPNGDFIVTPLHRDLVFTPLAFFCSLYWIAFLITTLQCGMSFLHFVLSYTGTVWYFSPPEGCDERDVGVFPSKVAVTLGLWHHIGSFALGGVLMWISSPSRLLANWVRRVNGNEEGIVKREGMGQEETKSDESSLKSFAQSLTPAGYIEMSISSTDFMESMKIAANRLSASRSSPTAFMCDSADLITSLSTLGVTASTTGIVYFLTQVSGIDGSLRVVGAEGYKLGH